MFESLDITNHVWFKGHSIEVVKYYHGLMIDGAGTKGWLYKCSCGKRWAR